MTEGMSFPDHVCIIIALDVFSEYDLFFIGFDADTHADVIRQKKSVYMNAVCLIWNSFSGILEEPSLMAWVVDIAECCYELL